MTTEEAVYRRLRWRLVPYLLLLYVIAWFDRVNISFAALQMNQDLGFSPAVYGLGAGIFFAAYALCEVPSNLILARVGARRWIARIMVTWGILSVAMMFVQGKWSFYTLRVLLGIAEAGFLPGVIYYLSQWFPQRERGRAVSWFLLGIPLSSVFGGPLAGLLLGLDGWHGLRGWQWLFILEGLPAILLGVTTWFLLPDAPRDARWLKPDERALVERRITEEAARKQALHGYRCAPGATASHHLAAGPGVVCRADRQLWTHIVDTADRSRNLRPERFRDRPDFGNPLRCCCHCHGCRRGQLRQELASGSGMWHCPVSSALQDSRPARSFTARCPA